MTNWIMEFINWHPQMIDSTNNEIQDHLTHGSLVTPYGSIDLGLHWFR